MRDTRTLEHKKRDQQIGLRAEGVASWYFRLNGFLCMPGFVVHLDQDKAERTEDGRHIYQRTEADLIGVRFVNSKEIIFAFDGEKVMVDDSFITVLCPLKKEALFVLVEVKTGLCMMNGPWTNRRKENMQRVIRRLGFALDEDQVQEIADDMYTTGRYEDEHYVMQYICVGNEKIMASTTNIKMLSKSTGLK